MKLNDPVTLWEEGDRGGPGDIVLCRATVPIESLMEFCRLDNENDGWEPGTSGISTQEVQEAVKNLDRYGFEDECYQLIRDMHPARENAWRGWHIRRIATLVASYPFSLLEARHPVTVLYHGEWLLMDGNHRLCAAVFNKETSLYIEIEGPRKGILERFGVEAPPIK